jgi:isopentenyl-diphosphate delta-isomerase
MDTEQDKMMEEECIMVDHHDVPTGHLTKRICHKNENIKAGMLHRAFSVFLFDENGRLLLQQRSKAKVTFPLYWTNTCCSHPLWKVPMSENNTQTYQYDSEDIAEQNEECEREETDALGVKRAARRKLLHEIGLPREYSTNEALHYLTKIYYCAPSDGEWGEHEIDWILFLQINSSVVGEDGSNLSLNENEVGGVKYVTKEELQSMIDQYKRGELLLTPWFALIAEKLLFGWWEKLADVIKFDGIGAEERKVIHRLS